MAMKLYTTVPQGLKLKFRKFWGLISMLVDVTVEKLVGRSFLPPSIVNKFKRELKKKRPESYLNLTYIV